MPGFHFSVSNLSVSAFRLGLQFSGFAIPSSFAGSNFGFLVSSLLVMFPERVLTEIVPQIAPNRVNVVGPVLCVVILHQKSRALDPVIMALPWFETARPGEMQVFVAGFPDLLQIGLSQFGAAALDVFLKQRQQQLPLG